MLIEASFFIGVLCSALLFFVINKKRRLRAESSDLTTYQNGLSAISTILSLKENDGDLHFLNKALSEISYQSKAEGIWLNYSFNPKIELEDSCLDFEIEYTYLIDHVEIKSTTIVHNAKGVIDGYLLLIPIIRKNNPQIIFTMRLSSKPDEHFIHTWEEVAEALWESMKKRHRAKKINRLKLLHDTTSNQGKLGLFDWNIATNQLSLSDGWKAQLGYKPDEIKSEFETWESRLHPEDKDRAIKIIEDSLASKSSEYFLEHRLKHKQGHYVWIRSMATVFYDEDKQPIRMVGAHVDLTEVKQKESQLASSIQDKFRLSVRHDSILANITDGVLEVDIEGVVKFINPAALKMLCLTQDEALGKKGHELWHKYDKYGDPYNQRDCPIVQTIRQGGSLEGQDYFYTSENKRLTVYRKVSAIEVDGVLTGGVISFEDISSKLEKEKTIRLAAEVFENTSEGIMVTDNENNIAQVNKAFETITGFSINDVKGKNPKVLSSGRTPIGTYQSMWKSIAEQGNWKGEIENQRADGSNYTEILSISKISLNEGETYHVGVLSDITEQLKTQERVISLSNYDRLTQLYNKHYFNSFISQNLDSGRCALLRLGIDRFKHVNDSMGHEYGDQLLIECARRLSAICLGHEMHLARVSGDEFSIFITDIDSEKNILIFAESLIEVVSEPYHLQGFTAYIGLSIGISFYPTHAGAVEGLISTSAVALSQAKKDGRGVCRVYQPDMVEDSAYKLEMESQLRDAVQQESLELYYQPQVDVATGRTLGYEALCRWGNPQVGFISPAEFIPIAEETGIIVELGRWALDQAGLKIAESIVPCDLEHYIAVNISAIHLAKSDLIKDVEVVLGKYNIPPNLLEIEITESFLIDNPDKALKVLAGLKSLGVKLAIDDFGTGYSSLGYLKELPIDCIKIDQSFTAGILDNKSDLCLVKAILAMAKGLELEVVAEGVETGDQALMLSSLGCGKGQGWYYGKPNPDLLEEMEIMSEMSAPSTLI